MKLSSACTILSLFLILTGCTDLSKVERGQKEDPLDPISETEAEKELVTSSDEAAMEAPAEVAVAEVPVSEPVGFPFDRTIEDIQGREIDVQILAKQDAKFGFQRKGVNQRFVMPIANLSEKDQAFLNDLDNGGNLESIEDSIAREAKLSGRSATWHRELARAEKEMEELEIPRLTALLIEGDSLSKTIEKDILYTTEFRSWAGKNMVLCLIRVEPTGSRMAMTSEKAENRRVARRYGVRNRPAVMINLPGEKGNLAVSLKNVETPDDLIREIQVVLDNPVEVKSYIESKDGVR